jgi:soluble lytic murein transglycosylase-like protein
MTKDELVALARDIAKRFMLNDALVCALVEQESSWNPDATRYEPGFYERYIAPMGLEDGEAKARSTSWGLCQVMGEVARELKYTGVLQCLCDPTTGLTYGCMHFANKLRQAQGDTYNALLRWNGGGNQAYPQQVIDRITHYVSDHDAVQSAAQNEN